MWAWSIGLPVDVGMADAAGEVLEAAGRRSAEVEAPERGTQRGTRHGSRGRPLLLLLVFIVHHQEVPAETGTRWGQPGSNVQV